MKKKQKKALYGEIGSFAIDLAKYTITGVIITALLKDFGDNTILIYSIGIISPSCFLGIGLLLIKLKEE